MRTLTADISVGEEMACFRVVELFGRLFNKLAVIIKFAEIIRRKLMVNLARCARIDIKRDAETLKTGFNEFMITVHYLLGGNSLFAGTDGYRHSVFVTTSDEKNITTFQT